MVNSTSTEKDLIENKKAISFSVGSSDTGLENHDNNEKNGKIVPQFLMCTITSSTAEAKFSIV